MSPSPPCLNSSLLTTLLAAMQDLNGMIDAAKYADLVLLMIDGGFGFEMETFEFLNILQASSCLWQCALSKAQTMCLGSSNVLPASFC